MGLTIQLVSCATTHLGNSGKPIFNDTNIPLKISAQPIGDPSKESFELIEVTLENTSENWLKINRMEVIIRDPADSKLSVVVGRDLKNWAHAMNFRLQKDDYNRQLLQLGLATTSIALSADIGSKNEHSGLAYLSSSLFLGTYAWAVVDILQLEYQLATQSERIPENHLYQSLSIPGKMFLRRWVLLNKPTHRTINTLALELETVEGERENYEIKL